MIKVRDIILGEGMPKVCIPITGNTYKSILDEAALCVRCSADVIEWRADGFEGFRDPEALTDCLIALRNIIKNTPLLFTLRVGTERMGVDISAKEYRVCIEAALRTGQVDMLDVEYAMDTDVSAPVISLARAHGVVSLLSCHDFEKTPPADALMTQIKAMNAADADMIKITTMARQKTDALVLLEALGTAAVHYGPTLFIGVAMGKYGTLSRVIGGFFGSVITFACAELESAPGQMPAAQTQNMLRVLYGGME